MTALMKGEPLVLVNGGEVFRTFCYVEDACDCIIRCIEHPDKAQGHTFNVGNPNNNIQVKALADLMIKLYSKLTGKPEGTTQTISGEEYYGKGYEDARTWDSCRLPAAYAASAAVVLRQHKHYAQ